MLYQVTVPHFCCGIETDASGIVRVAAPIIKWAIGKPLVEVQRWVKSKGGKICLANPKPEVK